jgi:hypothetical protein
VIRPLQARNDLRHDDPVEIKIINEAGKSGNGNYASGVSKMCNIYYEYWLVC